MVPRKYQPKNHCPPAPLSTAATVPVQRHNSSSSTSVQTAAFFSHISNSPTIRTLKPLRNKRSSINNSCNTSSTIKHRPIHRPLLLLLPPLQPLRLHRSSQSGPSSNCANSTNSTMPPYRHISSGTLRSKTNIRPSFNSTSRCRGAQISLCTVVAMWRPASRNTILWSLSAAAVWTVACVGVDVAARWK